MHLLLLLLVIFIYLHRLLLTIWILDYSLLFTLGPLGFDGRDRAIALQINHRVVFEGLLQGAIEILEEEILDILYKLGLLHYFSSV